MRQILINLFSRRCGAQPTKASSASMAHSDGDLVQLEVFVCGGPKLDDTGTASLAVCLARALLELQGAALVEVDDTGSSWRALTVLRKAAQPDFFNSMATFEHESAHLRSARARWRPRRIQIGSLISKGSTCRRRR